MLGSGSSRAVRSMAAATRCPKAPFLVSSTFPGSQGLSNQASFVTCCETGSTATPASRAKLRPPPETDVPYTLDSPHPSAPPRGGPSSPEAVHVEGVRMHAHPARRGRRSHGGNRGRSHRQDHRADRREGRLDRSLGPQALRVRDRAPTRGVLRGGPLRGGTLGSIGAG